MATIVFLFIAFPLLGQPITGNFQEKSGELEERFAKYNTWLQESGLSQVLETHKLSIKEGHINTYLRFAYEDTDSASVAWRALQQTFQAERGYPVEDALFFKLLHTMKVNVGKIDLQIYDEYDTLKDVCLYVGLRWNNIADTLEVFRRFCRAESALDIRLEDLTYGQKSISLSKVPEDKINGQMGINMDIDRRAVYVMIGEFAKKYFESRANEESSFRRLSPLSADSVVFEAKHFRREVFRSASNGWYCTFWNMFFSDDCDDSPREWLRFSLHYDEASKKLNSKMIGQYGSGKVASLSDKGYQPIEPTFEGYAADYLGAFMVAFENYLLTGEIDKS